MLYNETRREFKTLLNSIDKVDAVKFIAEYLAENIVLINGDTMASFEVMESFIDLFQTELTEQINERI